MTEEKQAPQPITFQKRLVGDVEKIYVLAAWPAETVMAAAALQADVQFVTVLENKVSFAVENGAATYAIADLNADPLVGTLEEGSTFTDVPAEEPVQQQPTQADAPPPGFAPPVTD